MEKTLKTYKERIDSNKMLDEVHILIKRIEKAKYRAMDNNPSAREYITQIPNAGILVYNKLNELIKQLENKAITGESVIYAALKKELSAIAINDNFNDILGYEYDEQAKFDQLQVITKPTIWQRIKKFINQKLFNVYLTDEDFERMDSYIKKRDKIRRQLTDNAIARAEAINDIELDEEFVSKSVINYLNVASSEKDFNVDIFKSEVGQELNKLNMPDMTKEIDEKMEEYENFMQRIKVETKNNHTTNKPSYENNRKSEDIIK